MKGFFDFFKYIFIYFFVDVKDRVNLHSLFRSLYIINISQAGHLNHVIHDFQFIRQLSNFL